MDIVLLYAVLLFVLLGEPVFASYSCSDTNEQALQCPWATLPTEVGPGRWSSSSVSEITGTWLGDAGLGRLPQVHALLTCACTFLGALPFVRLLVPLALKLAGPIIWPASLFF